jgi:hypothetical protein
MSGILLAQMLAVQDINVLPEGPSFHPKVEITG